MDAEFGIKYKKLITLQVLLESAASMSEKASSIYEEIVNAVSPIANDEEREQVSELLEKHKQVAEILTIESRILSGFLYEDDDKEQVNGSD